MVDMSQRVLQVEHNGSRLVTRLEQLSFPADLAAEIEERVAGVGARIELLAMADEEESRVCLMRSWRVLWPGAEDPGQRETWGTWAYPAELLGAVELLESQGG